MAGNNFTNQWNNQALQAKRLENVLGWDYPSQTQQIIATDVTVPYDVNWNTPSYGNQFCGGIKIVKTQDDKFYELKITLAGASSPTTFFVKTGDFLDVQAISISSQDIDLEQTSIVVYMGQSSENLFEPFYNNLFQPYYNFDVVADWGSLGYPNPSESDFTSWLTHGLGFVTPTVLDGYIYEPIIDDTVNGVYVGRIKCRLEVSCDGASWILSDYFFEINGLGDFSRCRGINIENNTEVFEYPQQNIFLYGLKEINFKYYSQKESNLQNFDVEGNIYVENIDLSFLQYCNVTGDFNTFNCYNSPLVKQFSNFKLFPYSTTSIDIEQMYGFRRFEYDLTNCNNLTGFYFIDSSNFTPDGFQRLGLEFINTSLLPHSLTTLGLTGNNITQMTAGYVKFPTSMQSLNISANAMVEFNPECSLPLGLTSLSASNNLFYQFDLNYPLPASLSTIDLTNNLIQRFNTQCPLYLAYLYLGNNQLTKMDFAPLLNSNLLQLVMSNNALNTFLPSVPLPALQALDLQNNNITSCIPKGTNGPNVFLLNGNKMTTAAWNEMNTQWATGITTGSGKQFYAYSNVNSVSTSPLQATMVSKGYTVTP
jgi:Leucine-rich repeat (LRR) protein